MPTTIIGAGPYGLALAAHLGHRAHRHRAFGSPMAAWSGSMPAGMFLKSEGYASSIADPGGRATLARYCAEHGIAYADEGWPVPIDVFVAYGRWFQEQLVPELEPTDVTSVKRKDEHFAVALASGETFLTDDVVVAVGAKPFAHRPEVLRDLPPGLVSHTSDGLDLASLAGRTVTVLGGGQSALESAALLADAGAGVTVVSRHPIVWPTPPVTGRSWVARARAPRGWLGVGWIPYAYTRGAAPFALLPSALRRTVVERTFGPAGSWWLRDRVEGRIPVLAGHHVADAGARGSHAVLRVVDAAGRETELESDQVLAATGFRVDVAALPFLDAATVAALEVHGGSPRLAPWFRSSVPGLHFVGLPAAATYGPSMRFVCGTRFAAARLSRQLAARPRR